MSEAIKRALRSSQKGFTLLELLAVMAIVGVLAGIVTTSISGTGEASRDAQATQDATTVGSAAAEFFSDQDGAEVLTPLVKTVLSNDDLANMETSSRWPELHATEAYSAVFPDTVAEIENILFLDETGATIIEFDFIELVEGFNAVDFDKLTAQNYLAEKPESADQLSAGFANYLWLFEKSDAAGSSSANASRNVAVFKLVTVQVDTKDPAIDTDDTVVLTYQQIV